AAGVRVVARLDNGADALGVVVAEQPDLVLVEESLAMLPGQEVVREIRQFSPHTLVVAQVAYGDRAGQMLDAARETRATVEREAKELRESAARHEQELRARAERTVAQLVASAKQEIGEAMRQVLGGSERLQRVEQHSLSLGATVPPDSGETVESPLAPASASYQRPDEDAAAS
ncbi:MAG: hypothetical protein KY438_10085, partial [Actinobacteria bacterium]|nr:hypothetical protein [Actinomycetota bacterium]